MSVSLEGRDSPSTLARVVKDSIAASNRFGLSAVAIDIKDANEIYEQLSRLAELEE